MKSAGSNRKLSATNYARIAGPHTFTNGEQQAMNRQALAVSDARDFDDIDASFFAPRLGSASYVSDEHLAALDQMIDTHGLKNVLSALQLLLEQRVEDGTHDSKGDLIRHLSRHSAHSRAAERLANLVSDSDIASL